MNNVAPASSALNGICPYFTIFPLRFPYDILRIHAQPGDWVLDPFCGRGTTNYASRILGLPSVGVDSSPVAVALSEAKLAHATPEAIMRSARHFLATGAEPRDVPEGDFWTWAFHPGVLRSLCLLREALLRDCRSDTRKALRAIILGALHGPMPKSKASYFSNQSPRTYAPKPRYAVKYWSERDLHPPAVDVLSIIAERAERYYGVSLAPALGFILRGDSREQGTYASIEQRDVRWVITSPPYYGMRTYIPDQWLRWWFLGGPSFVDYSSSGQIAHSSTEVLATQLRITWQHIATICARNARMVVRFGGINDRGVQPLPIIMTSLRESGWRIDAVQPAGAATCGRRQAIHFMRSAKRPLEEYDVWATRSE